MSLLLATQVSPAPALVLRSCLAGLGFVNALAHAAFRVVHLNYTPGHSVDSAVIAKPTFIADSPE
jgi:hypothetical protein